MAESTTIARFEWKQEGNGFSASGDYEDYDEVCIDRLTGRVVVRYDLGDPANYAKSHGGWTRREWLLKAGVDPDAEIDASNSAVPVPSDEAKRHASRKEGRAKREAEEKTAQDLLCVLGSAAEAFDYNDYRSGELNILAPALEALGYSDVRFYMIEEDSFGPLIRGCRAIEPSGKTVSDLGDLSPWLRGDRFTQRLASGERFEKGIKIGADGWPKSPALGWLITGGESGPGARPSHPDWFRGLRDQCSRFGTPYFHKQWGEWTPGENVEATAGKVATAYWRDQHWWFGHENLANSDGHIDDEPDVYRLGKRAAGRLLDGIEHNAMPEVS